MRGPLLMSEARGILYDHKKMTNDNKLTQYVVVKEYKRLQLNWVMMSSWKYNDNNTIFLCIRGYDFVCA